MFFFWSWIERICVLEIYVFLNHPLMMDEKMQSRCFFSRDVINTRGIPVLSRCVCRWMVICMKNCLKPMSKDIPIYFFIDIRCTPALVSAVTIFTMDKSYLFQSLNAELLQSVRLYYRMLNKHLYGFLHRLTSVNWLTS